MGQSLSRIFSPAKTSYQPNMTRQATLASTVKSTFAKYTIKAIKFFAGSRKGFYCLLGAAAATHLLLAFVLRQGASIFLKVPGAIACAGVLAFLYYTTVVHDMDIFHNNEQTSPDRPSVMHMLCVLAVSATLLVYQTGVYKLFLSRVLGVFAS